MWAVELYIRNQAGRRVRDSRDCVKTLSTFVSFPLLLYVTRAVTTSTSLMEAMKHLERGAMTPRVRSRNSIGTLVSFLLADYTLLSAVWIVWNKILLPTVVSYLSVRLSNYCPYIVHLRTFGLFKNITSWCCISFPKITYRLRKDGSLIFRNCSRCCEGAYIFKLWR